MKIKVLTSFGPGGWEAYAERFVKSFDKYWPADVDLEVCYHDQPKGKWPKSRRIKYRDINATDPEHDKFVANAKGISRSDNFRYDAIKFCHKVFALTSADLKGYDWLIWLDADVETFSPVSSGDLGEWLQNSDLVYLDRQVDSFPYPETSFLAFNLGSHTAYSLLTDLRGTYTHGEVFQYREWHDGFVFGRLLKLHIAHGLSGHSLTGKLDQRDSFDNSVLSKYMMHLKGPLKSLTPFHTGMRYDMMLKLIEDYKPKVIAEVGTWRGERAIQLAQAALQQHNEVTYLGFDLFEDATSDSDTLELNTKTHYTLASVEARLQAFADMAAAQGKKFKFKLTKGDTKKTLKGKDFSKVDFVFLDGGHSPDTVLNDWRAFSHVPAVVFDDYFKPDHTGKVPSPEHCGTNQIIHQLGLKFELLPKADLVKNGGLTFLAVVLNDPTLKVPEFVQPLKINPKDCVEQDHLKNNVDKNIKLIKKWLHQCQDHQGTAIVVSGGPSVEQYIPKIKDLVAKGGTVFCVKHAYPRLLKAGIKPFACVILDPRPITGTSTHGVKRKDLFAKVEPSTTFFVATMTDPSVTKYLLKQKANIVGWHAYSNAANNKNLPEKQEWIMGGTCAAFRTISIAHYLGFRKLELFGFDLCLPTPSEEDQKLKDEFGRPRYIPVRIGKDPNLPIYWSTGELLSAAQDFEKLVSQLHDTGMTLNIYGEGIAQETWKQMAWQPLPEFREVYRGKVAGRTA